MSGDPGIAREKVEALREKLERDAEQSGYHLNPDGDFTLALVEGLLVNDERFGYQSCPCRLASGDATEDMDIVCPCDYRDADLVEWGSCYCALYVSQEALDGRRKIGSIPERRPPAEERAAALARPSTADPGRTSKRGAPMTVWRCRVCGYLCAREAPPETCPICKAAKERFEKFWD